MTLLPPVTVKLPILMEKSQCSIIDEKVAQRPVFHSSSGNGNTVMFNDTINTNSQS